MRNFLNIKIITIAYLIVNMLSPLIVKADRLEWVIDPNEGYEEIVPLVDGIYVVKKDKKIALVDSEGKLISETDATEITPFYEDHALLLRSNGKLRQIIGIVDIDGTYRPMEKVYYAMYLQEFFSDGLLSVYDSDYRRGYLLESGQEAFGFNKGYQKILPFSEGYAAVWDDKKHYSLIDRYGKRIPINLGNQVVGEITNGSNVYNGQSVVWDSYNDKYYYFNISNPKKSKKIKNPKLDVLDYLGFPVSLSGRKTVFPKQEVKMAVNEPRVFEQDNMYGYETDFSVLTPAIFRKAGVFHGENAVAQTELGLGLVKYVHSDSRFKLNVVDDEIGFRPGHKSKCEFTYETPELWNDYNLNVEVNTKNSNDSIEVYAKDDRSVCFYVSPEEEETMDYRVKLYYKEKLLHEDDLSYSFVKKPEKSLISASIKLPKGNKANSNDIVPVVIRIYNNGDDTETVSVSIRGSKSLRPVSGTYTIGPKSSATISTEFAVTKRAYDQKITVTTDKGGSVSKSFDVLYPFWDN